MPTAQVPCHLVAATKAPGQLFDQGAFETIVESATQFGERSQKGADHGATEGV